MSPPPAETRALSLAWLAATLALLLGVAIAIADRGAPPAAAPADAPPGQFSAARAMADVRGITASGLPHPTGSDDHARVLAYLLSRLRELGLEPSVQRARACHGRRCADVENVVARIEGSEPGPALLLAAHSDSVPAGPGASDDGAGVATILEVVRALREGPPPRRTVIVLLDDGEELGLLGARAFVAEHPWARDVGVVLNFEARGTGGATSMFETSANNAALVELYAGAATRPTASSVIYALYKRLPNDTDLTVFKEAGMQGLNFAFADGVWSYHTPADTADRLDPRSLQHMGDQALAMTRAWLASPSPSPSGDAVYFDLFSTVLVTYRTVWVSPVALGAAGLAVGALVIALRRRRATALASARWLGVLVASLVAAIAAGIAVKSLIEALAGPISPWGPAPLPPWTAMVAAGVAASSGVVVALGPRRDNASPASGTAGALGLWTVLSLLFARVEPGASYLFVAPAAALAVGLLVLSRRAVSSLETWVGAASALLVAALVWFPLLRVLLVMVGAGLSPTATLPAALVVTTGAPLLAALAPTTRRIVPLGALAIAVGAALFTIVARGS